MKPSQVPMLLAILAACGCEQQGGNARAVPGVEASADSAGLDVAMQPPAAAHPRPTGRIDPKWSRAAPIVDGYSDPTRIVYDDAYLRSYEFRDRNIYCGDATYEIATPKDTIRIFSGLDEMKLGRRFRMDDLLRFLQTRRDNPIMEQVFPIRDVALLKRLRDEDYGWDPWTVDLRMVLSLVGDSSYKPAIPLIADLAKKDPDLRIRAGAAQALGRLARTHAEALDVLVGIFDDPKSYNEAVTALTMADGAAVPIFVKAFDRNDRQVRYAAVHALERITPDEHFVFGIAKALQHRHADVRDSAVFVLARRYAIGTAPTNREIVDGLVAYLSEADRRGLETWRAVQILYVLKPPPASARAALLKFAEVPNVRPDDTFKRMAREMITAIDAAERK